MECRNLARAVLGETNVMEPSLLAIGGVQERDTVFALPGYVDLYGSGVSSSLRENSLGSGGLLLGLHDSTDRMFIA
ncbi:Uncharacterised protein [Mycobacteroides abscessus subsp. abscessus]|nr:Uncharacterised protein [Mycobacteroides abscessus subsp. abscessus]